MSESDSKSQLAKKYSLGLPKYASIDFPLNVIHDDKAIELIGGKSRIKESLVEKNVPLELRLRPNDPYQNPIHSEVSTAENLLVKILLPKGELLKHKNNIAKAIDANKDAYRFEPVAIIDKSFRFREIADFQINTFSNEFLQQTTEAFFGNDFDRLKQFNELQFSEKDKYDTSKPLDLPPFPTFSKVKMPFSYNFTNNKGTAVKTEDGSVRLVNTKQPPKVNTLFISWDAPVPQHLLPELKQHLDEARRFVDKLMKEGKMPMNVIKNNANYQLVECVKLLESLFDQKPIWLRRHLYTITPPNWKNTFKYALAYVAYSTRTGPWKQSYIKFGVDPKESDAYALYQTERFRVHTAAAKNMEEDEGNETASLSLLDDSGHASVDKDAIGELPADFAFDGTNLPKISTFQLADIKDPQLTSLLTRDGMVSKVTERDGWFNSINLVQLRLIMRYKLTCLVSKEEISQSRLENVREMAINRFQTRLEQLKQKKDDSSGEDSDDGGDEDEDDEENENIAEETISLEGDLRARFLKADPKSLADLMGLLKQEDIMDVDSK